MLLRRKQARIQLNERDWISIRYDSSSKRKIETILVLRDSYWYDYCFEMYKKAEHF